MSEGPIKRERAAWEPPRVSTLATASVHWTAEFGKPPYCRTKHGKVGTTNRANVTCSNCLAALAADEAETR